MVCDNSYSEHENDPCHLSIYHAHEPEKYHCEHKSHVNEVGQHCEFCDFITSQRYTYIGNEKKNTISKLYSNALLYNSQSFTLNLFTDVIFNRGPPA